MGPSSVLTMKARDIEPTGGDPRRASDRAASAFASDAVTAVWGAVPALIDQAIGDARVVRLSYEDGQGRVSARDIEPVAFVDGGSTCYLLAWCRLRHQARFFRMDRIRSARLLDEVVDRAQLDVLLPHDARVRRHAGGGALSRGRGSAPARR